MQTGAPYLLNIIATFEVGDEIEAKVESTLHRTYNSYKTHGEWFDFSELNIEEIQAQVVRVAENLKLLLLPADEDY